MDKARCSFLEVRSYHLSRRSVIQIACSAGRVTSTFQTVRGSKVGDGHS